MYCRKCGQTIDDEAVICPKCGVQQYSAMQRTNVNDTGSSGYAVLGFLIPIVGLILFLCWKDTQPRNAKSCLKGMIIGFIVEAIIGIIAGIVLSNI